MTASGYHDARLGSGFSSLFRIYFEQTFAKHFLMFAGMLLNVDQFFAEFCRNSPNLRLNLGKILKMLKFCAVVVEIGVDTADTLIL